LGDMTTPPVFLPVSCKRLQFSLMASSEFEKPNDEDNRAHTIEPIVTERAHYARSGSSDSSAAQVMPRRGVGQEQSRRGLQPAATLALQRSVSN
jgi:hypothetical protein